jgi:hypothetical protein
MPARDAGRDPDRQDGGPAEHDFDEAAPLRCLTHADVQYRTTAAPREPAHWWLTLLPAARRQC